MTLTYNLTDVASLLQELNLSFDFAQHDQEAHPLNRVYVRGSDSDNWLELYDLDAGKIASGNYKQVTQLDILSRLTAFNQPLSSSFQIKFSQVGSSSFDNAVAQDGFTFDNISLDNGVVLPVEMAFFEVEKRGLDGIIMWSTHSELNNSHFEVEYADEPADGQDLTFGLLGQVRGAGTTSTPQSYQFIDTDHNKNSKRYYRIKQVDFDGTTSFSEVKILNFEGESDTPIQVFPNPAFEEFNIKVYSAIDGPLVIKITDVSGKEMETIIKNGFKGQYIMETIHLDKRYAEGYYIIHTQSGDTSQSFKVLKMASK